MSSAARRSPTANVVAPSASRAWRIGLTSIAIALVGNLAILAAARLTGAEMEVPYNEAAETMTVGIGSAALMTVAPTLLATLLLVGLRRRGTGAWRALATIGLVIGLVTTPAPFTVLAAGDTRAALVLMHVVTGAVWFVIVRRAAARSEA